MKKLLVYSPDNGEANFLNIEELEEWRTDGSIEEGDEIYEVKLLHKAKRKTDIYFEDVK